MNYILKKVYLLVLLIGILASLFLGYHTYNNNLEKEKIQFNSLTKNIMQQIKNRMDTYREVLYSGVGLFEASSDVSREEWNVFVNKLQIKKYFPGIQGLGYSVVLEENELQKHTQDIRKEGFPSYIIYPKGKRDLYTAVIYIEPFDERNKRAFGYDMYSEKQRRKAMSRTIKTGLPSLSSKVTLVQEKGTDIQAGFLLYTPLYKKNMKVETEEQRLNSIDGFVYAVFRAKNFINGAVGNSLKIIDVKMYDGLEKNQNSLLYDSNIKTSTNNSLNKSEQVEIDGHIWTFEFTAKNTFSDNKENINAIIFTILGFLITILMTLLLKRRSEVEVLKDDALFNVSQGVMVTNEKREIIYANKAFEDLTGYERESIYGQDAEFLQGKNTDLETIDFIKEKLNEMKPFECEILNYRKDGESFWNRLAITPIFDDKNKIKRYIGIQNDITEKKLLEKSMLFEKNLIENILSNTSAIIALIDMNGVMVKLNEYGKNFVGYTQEEISSEAYFWTKFIPFATRENVKKIIEEAKKNNLIDKQRNPWLSSEGEEKVFEWSNQIIKDSKGNPEYIITVGIDITNEVMAQEEHNKFQKQLSLSAEISGLAFWELNLKTKVFTLNDLYYSFLNTSIEREGTYQLDLERYFNSFIPNRKSQKIIMDIFEVAFTKNKDYQDSFEYEMKRRDGTILQVLVNYFVTYDKEGKPTKAYGTKYNLTKQKEKEKILIEAKRKAEDASRAKTEFLANMSHEIRTPLNGIIGLTNLMLETEVTSVQKNYLKKSIVSSKALLHVINDILDYSKIEVNKIELEHIPFQLDKMLHQVSNLFIYEAQNKNIDLECTIEPSIHNNLIGDPFRINQILINLVGNAIKFTDSGYIHISILLEELKEKTMKLNFSVKDTGIGISKIKQKKLFQNFSQVDTSNTRKYGGSGLGLVISRKLARIMGGEISVESTEGIGSTFNFLTEVEYTTKDYHFLTQDLKNKKVLVVNSDKEKRELINKTLKMFNLNTILCDDNNSALKVLEKEDLHYIILEWNLIDNDVFKLAKIVESTYQDKGIQTIILCSFSEREEFETAKKVAGLTKNKLLVNPFSSSSLLDVIVNNTNIKSEKEKNTKKLFAKGKALLVEDNEINQLVAKHNLENIGLEVSTAENGKIAVQKVKDEHYDIIFMDLQMPIMDGFEASRKIREFSSDIPIVALTAAVMKEDLKMTQDAGMNEHLSKPIDIVKLKDVIVKYLHTSFEESSSEDKVSVDQTIKGINLEELFLRLNGNKELAFQMLINFAEDNKHIINELNSLDIKSDEFKSLIHNLKGLSGNLSLNEVFKYSKKIDASDILEEKIELLLKLKESLIIVIKSINENVVLKTTKTNVIKNFTKDEILKDLTSLTNDISQGTFVSQDKKNLILDQVRQTTNDATAQELEKLLSNFDYKNAQIILEKIIGDLS